MREIVHIQAGQCGNQIGAKVSYLLRTFGITGDQMAAIGIQECAASVIRDEIPILEMTGLLFHLPLKCVSFCSIEQLNYLVSRVRVL